MSAKIMRTLGKPASYKRRAATNATSSGADGKLGPGVNVDVERIVAV
jgi:hypothetical protein